MSEPFAPEISNRICKHMNEDHADAVALYVKAYGGLPDTTAAQMQSIDAQGMELIAQVQDVATPVRIEFDHALVDAEDAHHTLIAMLKQARSQLSNASLS
ncbi:MAG: DUF2470 domain-containing protein [Leptolyngbyaceae bacterium]|nr:DUF2470 domain-containing protein [Leptolyngbyaceae bacterium]